MFTDDKPHLCLLVSTKNLNVAALGAQILLQHYYNFAILYLLASLLTSSSRATRLNQEPR